VNGLSEGMGWAGGPWLAGLMLLLAGLTVLFFALWRRTALNLAKLAAEISAADRLSATHRLDLVFARFPGLLILLDGDGRVVRAGGDLAARLSSAPPVVWRGRFPADVLDPPIAAALTGGDQGMIRPGQDQSFAILPAAMPLPGGERLIAALDVSGFGAQLAEAQDERAALKESDRLKGRFLANLGHELRTPLSALKGFAELIANQSFGPVGNERYAEYAGDIRDGAGHLLALVSELLDLSSIEMGRAALAEDDCDLEEIAGMVVRMFQGEASAKDISLTLQAADGLPLLHADSLRLKQVVINLISNAVKFTPPGGRITLDLREDAEGVWCAVADSGIGMRPEDVPRALEPFVQLRDEDIAVQGGTGLGLPLAKHFVELHGGRFLIETAPKQGTAVRFLIPVKRIVRAVAAVS